MLSRIPAVTRCLSLAALCAASSVHALEFPLPPPGEDIVGEVQVIKARYEDTFADLGTKYDLGYLEMIAANPGVDPWCRARARTLCCRPVSSCRRVRAKVSSSTWPNTACITTPKAECGAHGVGA